MLKRNPTTFPIQDQFGKADNPPGQRGNCNQACLAALMDLPLDDVPHFFNTGETVEKQREHMLRWMAMHGWVALYLPWSWVGSDWLFTPEKALVMVSGKSPRGNWGHVVIGRLTRTKWQLIHDPHPSGDGLDGTPDGLYLIVPVPTI